MHAHLVQAQIAWCEDRIRDGTRHALDAAGVVPDDVEAFCAVAGVLLETGESVAARDCLDRGAPDACDDPRLLMRLAALRKRLEQHAAELALLDRARTLGHPSAALRYSRGSISNGSAAVSSRSPGARDPQPKKRPRFRGRMESDGSVAAQNFWLYCR